MSLVENNKANSQMEEHFEFTPSPEHALKKHDDDADEDFSYANGDNSYSSLKSATFSSQRNTWMRSSVRRNGRRSSLSYESDEMNADANLEEDVQNLNDQIKKLQEQIEVLSEAQMKNEVKYSSMKRENVNLGDKISFLEEHIRDIELQTEERKTDDERRFKESMARLEREKSQELEKYVGQILALQKELFEAKEEVKRHQQTIDTLQSNKLDLESTIQDKEAEIESLNEEIAKLKDVIRKQSEESHANSTLIEALNHEVATIRQSSDLTKLEHHRMAHESEVNNINVELEKQVRSLKEENHSLKESNEELTAQLLNNHLIEGKSLLKEGEAISSLANEISDLNIEQLKTTLKEQQDVNAKLRAYIDGILLNIVENYPQLLEVKSN